MRNIQTLADKTAISLSFLCAIHCLAMPLLVTLLPALVALPMSDEAFHKWMLFGVIPISAAALLMGCKKHKRYRVLITGFIGLSILAAAALLGHDLLGETGEKTLTVIGAAVLAIGHFWNYRTCQNHEHCGHDNE